MKKEINVSYIKICRMLKLNEHRDKHIIKCPLECNEMCKDRLIIWRNFDRAKCLGIKKEIRIGELDMILVSEFDEEKRKYKGLMRTPF